MATTTIYSKTQIEELLAEVGPQDTVFPMLNRWLARGDGIAVYENVDLGHPEQGHKQFVSFGSPSAMLEAPEAPHRLPDIGDAINWRYQLCGTYRGEALG